MNSDIGIIIDELEKTPIFAIEDDIGVTGFASFNSLIVCVPRLSEPEDIYTIYSTFILLVHVGGHKMLKLAMKNQNASTPRGKEPNLTDIEGGYRLEWILFGSYSVKIFLSLELIKKIHVNSVWSLSEKLPILEEKDLEALEGIDKFKVGGNFRCSGLSKRIKAVTWKH